MYDVVLMEAPANSFGSFEGRLMLQGCPYFRGRGPNLSTP